MHCAEFQDVMRSFLDGEVDRARRREIGRHLAECTACAELVESSQFWDETVRGHLNRELPDGLREDILGDLVPHSSGGSIDHGGSLDHLGARKNWQIVWWAIRRDLSRPRGMLQAAALAVAIILALNYLPFFNSSDAPNGAGDAFLRSGPIMQAGQDGIWQTGETVPTARLTLSGRLI